jgi:hypothetical protein
VSNFVEMDRFSRRAGCSRSTVPSIFSNLRSDLANCVCETEEGDCMHGQKKRRKRTAAGSLDIDGTALRWQLISEPQWTSEGSKGLCFSVTGESEHTLRELVLEYPFEQTGWRPQLPQRPAFSSKMLEADIRKAIAAGWDPASRGKAFVFLVPRATQADSASL